MPTRQNFDNVLAELSQDILDLGKLIETKIGLAVESMCRQDLELANSIIVGDLEINELQANIEEKCILIIATQQPFAKDLRKIVAGFKISIYLERMGDLAVDLAKMTTRIGNEKLIKPLIDIPRMSEIVQEMMRKGLNAYLSEDVNAAKKMSAMDDEVDHLYRQIFNELLIIMMQNPQTITQANYLLFAARFLERIGDYCTNIAEETVYLVTASRADLND